MTLLGQWRGWMRCVVAMLAVLAGVAAARPAVAQGVEVAAGSSSLLSTQGVTVTHYEGDRVSLLSVGSNGNGFVMGGATELHRPDGVTRYGDTAMSFVLPTDIDPAGRAVGARGVDWREAMGVLGNFRVFAGKTGDELGVGYLRSVDPQRWGSSVEWAKVVSPKVRLSAIGAVGAAHAALVSGEYVFGPKAEVAATTGWNAGHGILAVSAKLQGETWNARVSETLGQIELRPETAAPHALDEAHIPERAGLNFAVEKRFTGWLQGDAERVQYGKDVAGGLPDGAVLHEAGATARQGDWTGGVRGLASHDGVNQTRGVATLAAWMHGAWKVDGSLLESWRTDDGWHGSVLVEGTRDVAGRVRVTAGADFAGSSPSVVAGAEVHGRWGSVGVSERMVYVPFGTQSGFTKVTAISVHLHPKGVETTLETLAGKGVPWVYTAAGDKFVEMGAGAQGLPAGLTQDAVAMPKYVVRGRVVDDAGAPVAAAAVRVNDATTVWTDSNGQWEARERRPGAVRLQVATAEFVTARRYEAVDGAGEVAWADRDAAVTPVVLRVKACGACGPEVAVEATPQRRLVPVQEVRMPVAAMHKAQGPQDVVGLVKASFRPLKRLARMIWRGDMR